jgi:exonuclease III
MRILKMCKIQTTDFLSIATWNINGLYEKTSDKLFINELSKHDVIFLTETHLNNEDQISIQGYYDLHRNHHHSKNNGKIDGGIAMLCKEHLKDGIEIVNDQNPDYLWFKFNKDFFSLEEHLYVCAAYLPHEQSHYLIAREKDTIESLEDDIANFSKDGYILLAGDLNARSSTLKDYVDVDCDVNLHDDEMYVIDENVGIRCNQDLVTNDRGAKLAELCIQCRLRILNGRTLGDSQGNFTCHRPQGSSTVDYMILSEEMLHRVQSFLVHDKLDLSDHCKISMWLKCKVAKIDTPAQVKLSSMPPSYKWTDSSAHDYQHALNSKEINDQLSDLLELKDNPDEDTINYEVQLLNNVIHNAAIKSLKTKRIKPNRSNNTQPWYTPSLKNLRQRVNNMGKLIKKFPKDPLVTGTYHKLLKDYRRTTKLYKRKYKQEMIDKLDTFHEQSPKEYWKLLNKLKNGNKCHDQTSQIDPGTWLSHFKYLNNSNGELCNTKSNTSQIPQPILNRRVEACEVQRAIKILKNNKACGLDGISNEMIKYGQHVLTQPLTKIFNDVLKTAIYPKSWAQGYISPIYKSGNPLDPSNYRGITITSCIAKVFNSVMNNRLDEYLTDNQIIHESQIAFKKKSRTSDHMFILRTLIDKVVKNDKKKIYACFVDFQKAFDSIPHWAMLHKLEANGINGNFLKTIQDMYTKTSLCVKTQQKLTTNFPGEVGVRQGDVLSPNIFKLFINDLPETVVTQTTNPPKLGSKAVGCLMYADDLVLLSESKEGLQTNLENLTTYCKKWGLRVNTKKTKIIIFNTRKASNPDTFWMAEQPIQVVDEYRYLGIIFKSNGTFDNTQQNLYHRGLKAYFKMAKMLSTEQSASSTVIHLFDHTVKPILLYASEVWGCINPNLRRIKNQPSHKLAKGYEKLWAEKLHLKMCRYILGVNQKTSTLAVRGEMGRYPLYLEVALNVLKYYNHILVSTSDLLSHALQVNREMVNNNKYCWLTWVNTILLETGLDSTQIKLPPSRWLNKVKRTLKGNYFSLWKNQVNIGNNLTMSRNKLRTYNKFKASLVKEPYIDILRNRTARKLLAQFRTSSHKLHIETGRYHGTHTLDRTCLTCNSSDIEDEEHFLTQCPSYSDDRQTLFRTVKVQCPQFDTLTNEQKLIWLMTTEDSHIIHALATFLNKSLSLRSEILRSTQ